MRELPSAFLKSGDVAVDAGVDDGDADALAGDAGGPRLVGADGLREVRRQAALAAVPCCRCRRRDEPRSCADPGVERDVEDALGRARSARACAPGSLTAKPLMAGSRSVTRPWWARTIVRACFSDRPGLNWASATTWRFGDFLAAEASRAGGGRRRVGDRSADGERNRDGDERRDGPPRQRLLGNGTISGHLRAPVRAASCSLFHRRALRPSASADWTLVLAGTDRPQARISAATPGPSSAGDVALQAAHPHRGLARVLGAHEVGGRRRLVGDRDHGRVQLAPGAVGAPAPVLQRRPARRTPIATSHWPVAPGAAEGVGDHHRGAPGQRARAARAPSRPGRAAAGRASPARPRWTRPRPRSRTRSRGACGRSAGPRRRARARAVSDRTTSTWRGSLPCSAASASARAPGVTSASRTIRPSALRDHLVGDDEHVGRRAARRRPRAISAARSSPGRTSGRPGQRVAARSSRGRCLEQRARAGGAARARGQRAAQRREVVRRVDVEPERAARRRPAARRRRRGRAPAWRANEPSPNAGAITSGGVSSSALVPVPVAVGHDHDRRRCAASSALDLVRVERRAVAGHEQHALGAALARRRDPERAPPPTGPPRPGRGRRARPRRARSAAWLGGDDDHLVEPAAPARARRARRRPSPRPAPGGPGTRRPAAAWRGRRS